MATHYTQRTLFYFTICSAAALLQKLGKHVLSHRRLKLRNGAQQGGADDVVVFEFDGFVLFGVGGGFFAEIADVVEFGAHLVGPVAGDDHARVVHVAFGDVGGAGGVSLVGEGNPVVHDGSARVDGEAEAVAVFAGNLHRADAKTAAGPDDGDGSLVEVLLEIGDGFFEFSADKFVGGGVGHVDVVDVAVRLVIHPAFGFEGDVVLQGDGAGSVLETDPGVDDSPTPLFVIGTEVCVEVFAGAAVILDEQDGARRNVGVIVEEVRHLCGVDSLKALLVQVVHHLVKVFDGDVVGGDVHRVLFDAVKHDDHDDGARGGVVRFPFVVEVTAGVGFVGVRDVKGVDAGGSEGSGQGGRCADGSRRGDGGISRDGGGGGLESGESGLVCLGGEDAHVEGGGGGLRRAGGQ